MTHPITTVTWPPYLICHMTHPITTVSWTTLYLCHMNHPISLSHDPHYDNCQMTNAFTTVTWPNLSLLSHDLLSHWYHTALLIVVVNHMIYLYFLPVMHGRIITTFKTSHAWSCYKPIKDHITWNNLQII